MKAQTIRACKKLLDCVSLALMLGGLNPRAGPYLFFANFRSRIHVSRSIRRFRFCPAWATSLGRKERPELPSERRGDRLPCTNRCASIRPIDRFRGQLKKLMSGPGNFRFAFAEPRRMQR